MNAPITSLWCPKEKAMATQLIPKFRVTFRVQDSTGSASFLMFDRDVSKIIGLSATDIRERQLKSDQIANFPYELDKLLNKKFAFKICISKYNLDKKYSVYTVLKVCDDPVIIHELDLMSICQGKEDSQPEDLSTVKLDDDSQTGISSKEKEDSDFADCKNEKLDEDSTAGISSKDVFTVTGESLAIDVEQDTEISPAQKRNTATPALESTNKMPNKMRKINIGKAD